MPEFFFARLIGSALTLYMMAILLRWAAPYIELDTAYGKLNWIERLTEPYLGLIRRYLPAMGPFDFTPFVGVLLVYLLRLLVVEWPVREALL